MHKLLKVQSHRPFPPPDLPWIMSQYWEDVLFLHWPVPVNDLRKHIPHSLELDVFDGKAYLGILLFQVNQMRPRYLPPFPKISSFLELNVRSYVNYNGKPGVYFFHLDTDSLLTVKLASMVYSLPYRKAELSIQREGNERQFQSQRRQLGKQTESFHTSYQPISPVYYSKEGTLEHWLTERYCLWTGKGNSLLRADIHHTKWELQEAAVDIQQNTMAPFLPRETLAVPAMVHYCKVKQALLWPPVKEF